MEKAYIFDIISKIYLATDSNPSDSDAFGLCSDVIDTVIAFAGKFDPNITTFSIFKNHLN